MCQWGFKLSSGSFISKKVAISSQHKYSPLCLTLFLPSIFSFPHPQSQNTSCCFPTRHFGLWSALLEVEALCLRRSTVGAGAGDVSCWSQCVQATRRTGEITWSRHCAWFVTFQTSCQVKIVYLWKISDPRRSFSAPSEVLVWLKWVSNYDEMIYRQWHLMTISQHNY